MFGSVPTGKPMFGSVAGVAILGEGGRPHDAKGRGRGTSPLSAGIVDATTYDTQPRTLGPQPPKQEDPRPVAEGDEAALPELNNTAKPESQAQPGNKTPSQTTARQHNLSQSTTRRNWRAMSTPLTMPRARMRWSATAATMP
jgi:hypothetical protein